MKGYCAMCGQEYNPIKLTDKPKMLIHKLCKLVELAKSGEDTQPAINDIIDLVVAKLGKQSRYYLGEIEKLQNKTL